jgi:two-component system, OmpR family, sensor histidine kinase KdpD
VTEETSERQRQQRGSLTVYLGYAAGVGKTYQMLVDAQELRARGVDIIVGYFEPHARKDTISKTEGLEIVPRCSIEYRGVRLEEMDSAAIIRRNPQVCVVDEFPHTNAPGSPRAKRWEDVEALRDSGIGVLTTMNIQHLESLNDQVFQLTGVRVRETIPDWVMQSAQEVVMVDLTPRALLNRLERGVVYSREKAERALVNFFREQTLVALREMALRQTAHEVEQRAAAAPAAEAAPPSRHRRILVLITEHPETAMLIRRARRVSDFLGAECFAVTVQPSGDLAGLDDAEREAIERHLNFARNLRLETRIVAGRDPAEAVVEFAHRNLVTQIYLTRPHHWQSLFSGNLLERIVRRAKDMEIVIVGGADDAARKRDR